MTPTVRDMELEPGDELGLHTPPTCCDDDMATARNGFDWVCRGCGSRVLVSPNGIVTDIR